MLLNDKNSCEEEFTPLFKFNMSYDSSLKDYFLDFYGNTESMN